MFRKPFGDGVGVIVNLGGRAPIGGEGFNPKAVNLALPVEGAKGPHVNINLGTFTFELLGALSVVGIVGEFRDLAVDFLELFELNGSLGFVELVIKFERKLKGNPISVILL